MKGYNKVWVMVLALAMMLAIGCAKTAPEATPTPAATPQPTVQPTQEPTPEPTPEQTPGVQLDYDTIFAGYPGDINPANGLPLGGEAYKPILVTISGAAAAFPHSGISKADIIYEIMHDTGGVTRFLAVFASEYPQKVGPVRSTRVPYLQKVMQWPGAGYAYGGNSTDGGKGYDVRDYFDQLPVAVRANGVEGPALNLFTRSSDRKAPHNLYVNVEKMLPLVEQPAPAIGHFIFSDAVQGDPDGKDYELTFFRGYTVKYEYDAQNHVYLRYCKGKPMMDKETNTQIAVSNVVVQYVDFDFSAKEGLAKADYVGQGRAEYLIDGRHIQGAWKQESIDSQTMYFDDAGDPIQLKPGKIFIDVPNSTAELTQAE
ncbi:MAG: DUF3048 domain-containing protein [Eubacteriales bacterium]|nr:DUF3048 domain-containing protein [Eubacteriales bacterium]